MQQTIYVDRSRHELSFECPREYFWTYHFNGKGIVPKGNALYFVTGEAIHVGVQCSMLEVGWEDTKAAILNVFALHSVEDQEQRDIAVALVYNWRKLRLTAFLQEYRVLRLADGPFVEREIVVPIFEDERYKVLLMSRPDIVVERLYDHAALVWELKSTGVANDSWTKKWEHAAQVLLQARATQHYLSTIGDTRPVVGVIVEGLVKGQRKKDASGLKRFSNSLIYSYVKRGDGFVVPHQYSTTWRKYWDKELISQHMPLEQWIDGLPLETLNEHVRVVPPILASPENVDSVCRQVAAKAIDHFQRANSVLAEEVGSANWSVALDELFPQNFNNCLAYGEENACGFMDVCFQHNIGEDPLGSGLYTPREPNHAVEV